MVHSNEPQDIVIHRDPPSDYASATYAVVIVTVASLLVATAALGIFNGGAAPPAEKAAQSKTEAPAPTAAAADKSAEAPAAEAVDKPADAAPPTTSASSGEAGSTAAPPAPDAAREAQADAPPQPTKQ